MKKDKKEGDFQDFLLAQVRQHAPKSSEYGTWEVSSSNRKVMSKIKYVLTTGIQAFDQIVGGFPFGRIVELFGLEGCGKTALAIRAAIRARGCHISEVVRGEDGSLVYRPLDKDEAEIAVLYIDNEQSLDEDGKLIVDGVKEVIGTARCDTVEGMFKMVDESLDATEARTEITADTADKSGKPAKIQFVVIIVDTIASTSSRDELSADWGKRDFPRVPQAISAGFSRLTRRFNTNNACMICTNQVRTHYGAAQQRGPQRGQSNTVQSWQYRSLGGLALKYYASHRVFMHAFPGKYKLAPDAKFSAGLHLGFHTVKNRLRPPLRDGRMVLLFDKSCGGINDAFSLLETLVFTGFIEVVNKEKGTDFVCKFKKSGVVPKTFDSLPPSLDEQDDAPVGRRRRREPGFKFRAEWPKFYEVHRVDIEALWDAAVKYVFDTPGLDGLVVEQDELVEEMEEE
jgi:RecA/RadA recombinase